MKLKFNTLKSPLLIIILCIIMSISLTMLNNTFSFTIIIKILSISLLNFIILLRIKHSYSLLNKVKTLENLNFPMYKDITVILLGGVFFLVTYIFLFLDCLGFIDIFNPIGQINIKYKIYLLLAFLIPIAFAFFSNITGIIVTPYYKNGIKTFKVKEHTVLYGNELLNRATGSFKNGIIIGYYIFYFKDIQKTFKDNTGNIIITGFNKEPFKIIISANRSKAYFSSILNVN